MLAMRTALAVGERLVDHGMAVAADSHWTSGTDLGGVFAGFAIDIVEIECDLSAGARCQEARQHEISHHRIAHGERTVGATELAWT